MARSSNSQSTPWEEERNDDGGTRPALTTVVWNPQQLQLPGGGLDPEQGGAEGHNPVSGNAEPENEDDLNFMETFQVRLFRSFLWTWNALELASGLYWLSIGIILIRHYESSKSQQEGSYTSGIVFLCLGAWLCLHSFCTTLALSLTTKVNRLSPHQGPCGEEEPSAAASLWGWRWWWFSAQMSLFQIVLDVILAALWWVPPQILKHRVWETDWLQESLRPTFLVHALDQNQVWIGRIWLVVILLECLRWYLIEQAYLRPQWGDHSATGATGSDDVLSFASGLRYGHEMPSWWEQQQQQQQQRDGSQTERLLPRNNERHSNDRGIPTWVASGRGYRIQTGLGDMTRRTRSQANSNEATSTTAGSPATSSRWWASWLPGGRSRQRNRRRGSGDPREDGSVDFASVQEEWASRTEEDPFWWTREDEEFDNEANSHAAMDDKSWANDETIQMQPERKNDPRQQKEN